MFNLHFILFLDEKKKKAKTKQKNWETGMHNIGGRA